MNDEIYEEEIGKDEAISIEEDCEGFEEAD